MTQIVMPGSNPEVHVEPTFCEVAKPIPEEPPSARNRPAWKTATTVLPVVTVWASTSVWCRDRVVGAREHQGGQRARAGRRGWWTRRGSPPTWSGTFSVRGSEWGGV